MNTRGVPASSTRTLPSDSVVAEMSQSETQPRPSVPGVLRPEIDCMNWRLKSKTQPGAGNESPWCPQRGDRQLVVCPHEFECQ